MNASKGRIVVVDDNLATRYVVVRALRSDGHDVLECGSGRAALAMAHEVRPDLLVLDIRLPDILGYEVAERLRSDAATQAIAILQLSASFTTADAQAQGLRRGADAYLTHPVEPQVLLATVAALLRMRSAEQVAQAERARAEASENRYRFLADMVPQLIWSTDPAGRPDYFNQRWADFSGLSAGGGVPADWEESIHPDDRARFRAAWQHALATGEPLETEIRRYSPPVRSFRWLLVRALPMKDPQGKVLRWFGTSTDIEAQKQDLAEHARLLAESGTAAAERDKLVEQLQEEARRKNEFLAVLSHELRNPLAPIRNSLYILERAAPDGEQARRARAVIDRQAQQMTRLVDDLLDVTRIARGKIRLQREDVDLNALMARSIDDHRGMLKRAGLELELRTWDGPLRVHGDAARISQVIGNLLQNAAKFTPSGGKVTVTLEFEPPGEAVIRVRDTGAGIGAETLAQLFQPFVQGDRTLDRSKGGLGLGLALAQGIVELHGGSISASSEGPGRGAEFVVRLPVESAARTEAPRRDESTPFGRRRVLVIEDLPDAADSLREALALSGHDVTVAYDGASGLELARKFGPDVIVCDIGLPGMDGFAVAREIRKNPRLRSTFLVALTGYALGEDVEKSRAAGFDAHMAKPPRLDLLERLMASVPARSLEKTG